MSSSPHSRSPRITRKAEKFELFRHHHAQAFRPTEATKIDKFMMAALDEAKRGLSEGGIPIGSVLVKGSQIIGRGHNRRVQESNPILHAEIDCLRNAGRIGRYEDAVLYSTLMPCYLCAGAVVQFGIKRVIAAEAETFAGARQFMESHGVRVENLDLAECKQLMRDFIRRNPALWSEDIGAAPSRHAPSNDSPAKMKSALTEQDRKFMRRAIQLSAETSLVNKAGGVFGAVIVDKSGKILAEGANRVVAENDPTWHGEIEAIRKACKKVGSFKLTGCTLYSSAECCPMCAAAAYWAGIQKIFYAATCGDALEYGNFDDQMIYREVSKPSNERSLPAEQMLREEAVEVWKKYKNMPDRVQY